MTKALLIGGSGVLGSAVVAELQKNHVDFRIGSRHPVKTDSYSPVPQQPGLPWTRIDLITGDGLEQALVGVDTVFHLASGQGKIGREAVDVVSTRNLVRAIKHSDVRHLIYSSIVGIDKISYSYYKAKLEAEDLIRRSQLPYTILRATQFHDFVDFVLGKLLRLPIGFIPEKLLIQPIHVNAVAHELHQLARAGNQQRVLNLGGPQVFETGTLAKKWMQYRQVVKPIVPIPIFGSLMTSIAKGSSTCPETAVGTKTWDEYLAERLVD